MNEVPNNLPKLSKGKQNPGTNQVCAEQAIGWLVSGRLDLGDETDHPECVQPVLNHLAIVVNDSISDERRHEMWPILLRQPGTAKPEMEPILSVRLACFLAEKVLHLVPEAFWARCRDAIVAAQVWCDNPTQENAAATYDAARAASAACDAARAASYAYDAARAASAASYAYDAATTYANAAASYASAACDAARAAVGDDALLTLLREAQDECERLTSHVPPTCDIQRLERLGELVGTV
jgi:hypothetical protein